ncbi:MAG: hypothetical protein ISEC1_P1762 [Thiomicrorhabdus sp.]|nr:MAG: hypothetical protein ISEC1_P1762 [Thiomicrorhabdus sp.]
MSSTDIGITEHSFSISLPTGIDCRLVMTTNENDVNNRVITAIQINTGGVTSGLVSLNGNFDMGNIPLEMDRNNIIDANNDSVLDSPLTLSMTLPNGVVIREVAYDLLDKDGDGLHNVKDSDDDNDGQDDAHDEGDRILDEDDSDHD